MEAAVIFMFSHPPLPLGTTIGLVNSKQCRQIPRIRHTFSGEKNNIF